MKKSSCELLQERYPKISEVEDLRSTFIANCVFNIFFAYTAIMLNIATMHALKISSSPKTLKALLLGLAVSDVGVGLFVQPFYTSILVKWFLENNPGCSTYMAFLLATSSFCSASFLGVVAVSTDRFLAIYLHLRYQELVTHKRVVAVVISIWAFSLFLPSMALWFSLDIFNIILFVPGVLGLLATTLVYIRIYLAVRRHKNQIQVLQVQQTCEMANFASLVKSAVCLFYVYLVFLICYLPYFICLSIIEVNGTSIALKKFLFFSTTLVFLNSSLNPLIYCWKMRHIRHAFMDILRKMSWFINRASRLS